MNLIRDLAPFVAETCIITDVCSTKAEIANFVEALSKKLCFIGGHPMAGTEKSGYASSSPHLFENAYYVLTPCPSVSQDALGHLVSIIRGIGAIPVIMSAEEHDRAAAGISHLPHVIAAALVNLVREMDSGSGRMQTLAAGGFRDITRIASSSPVMWENIVFSNKAQIKELIAKYKIALDDFSLSLERDDSEAVYNFFAEAGRFRDSISNRAAGMIQPEYRLVVDVEDRPGIIGEIATILGSNNINIKNINVTNSREFEQGCLIIDLPDDTGVNKAFDLLVDTGYKVFRTR
jgi:prephenate dehydrogenase